MLHEFLSANRLELISRCSLKVVSRGLPGVTKADLDWGVPLFLDQLTELLLQQSNDFSARGSTSPHVRSDGDTQIGEAAIKYGCELFRAGFTVGQVVHDYGDLCQAVTELAWECNAEITNSEFKTLNRCLDDAIAGAVSEFQRRAELSKASESTTAMGENLGLFVHELKLIEAAILAAEAIKLGHVGIAGSTGAILSRNLSRLQVLTADAIFHARLMEGIPTPAGGHDVVLLSEFIEDIQATAASDAKSRGLRLMVPDVEAGLTINVDRRVLASAVGNMLLSAFKLGRPEGRVWLNTVSLADRILIEVECECSPLSAEMGGALSRLFDPGTHARLDAGDDLQMSRRDISANGGTLQIRSLPGIGCVFTVDFPRQGTSPKVA